MIFVTANLKRNRIGMLQYSRLFIIFILFILPINCLKFGYLTKTPGDEDLQILQEYIKQVNQGLVNDIVFTELDCRDLTNQDFLDAIGDKELVLAYGRCETFLTTELTKVLTENNVLIWCTDQFAKGSCQKSVLRGISIVPAIEQSMFIITSSYSTKIAVILDSSSDYTSFYYERIEYLTDLYNAEIIYDSHNKSTFSSTDWDEYITNITSTDDEVVTLLLLTKISDYNDLVASRKAKLVDVEKNPLLLFEGGGITYEALVEDANYAAGDNKGSLFITSYNNDLDDNKTKEFKQFYDNFVTVTKPGSKVSKSQASVGFALIDMLAYVSENVPSNRITTLLTYVYGQLYEKPGGDISILSNHFMTSSLYIAKETGSKTLEYPFKIAADLSLELLGMKGQMVDETCDFTENTVDGSTVIDYLPIIFIQDMTLYTSKVITEFVILLLDSFNNNKPLLSKTLFPVLMNIQTGNSVLLEQIKVLFNKNEAKTIFLFTNEEDRVFFYEGLSEYDTEIFYVGPNEAGTCKDDIIFVYLYYYYYYFLIRVIL